MLNNPDRTKSWKKIESIVIIIFFVMLFGVLANISLSAPIYRWGDGSTYYMQISSIVEDHDIQYQPIDIQRALVSKIDGLPYGLFLIKTDDGKYFYGKEFSYALFTSPFYALLGNSGILFFNALMFWFMILMGFFYLSKKGNSSILSFFTSLVFYILSTSFVYIFWIHAEIFNMFLITAGIFFLSLCFEDGKKEKYLVIGAFIFGLATVSKLPNCFLFLPFLCNELYNRQFKRVILIFVIFLIPVILFYGFFYLETGSMSFYGGNRLYYANQYPFTGGFDSVNESGYSAFSVEEGRISALISTDILTKSPYNFFYYFFGRFSGMVWYYPLTVFALLLFVLGLVYIKKQNSENFNILSIIKENPIQYLIFVGICFNILFYVTIIGNNYLGGQHVIGNRYFYIFPAFLFLIGKINIRVIIPFIIIALFTVTPLIADPIGISQYPETHSFEFPYTLFPVEYSQINNLPIWAYRYTFSDYSIYDIDGHSSLNENIIHLIGTSHWLIKTTTKNQNFSFIIFASDMGKKQVTVVSETHQTDTIIDDMNAEIVNIPLTHTVYEDAEYQLYSINFKSSSDVYILPLTDENKIKSDILYLTGWYNIENWNNIQTTWNSGDAILVFFSDNYQNKSLNLEVFGFQGSKNLNIIFQKEVIANSTIPSMRFTQINVPISIQKGANIIRLYVPEGCKRPVDIPELNSNDPRCLSIAIQNVTIS